MEEKFREKLWLEEQEELKNDPILQAYFSKGLERGYCHQCMHPDCKGICSCGACKNPEWKVEREKAHQVYFGIMRKYQKLRYPNHNWKEQ